jgi:CrcB protein
MTDSMWIAFLVAAAIGAPARYLIDGFVQDRTDGPFPWGTFVVNVSGCLILGIISGLGLYHGLDGSTRTVLGTGGLGAYTTFSTFTFETVRLAEEGAASDGLRNAAASFVVGLAAASAGLALAALL